MAVGTRNYGRGAGSSFGQFRQAFFDSDAILKSMDRATNKAFSKFGAFVRRRAQTSIRYRQKPSAAGSPPSAHRTGTRLKRNRKTGVTKRQPSSPLRDNIYFAYDKETKSVVIGPTLVTSSSPQAGRPQGKTVPQTLEEGGAVTLVRLLRADHATRRGMLSKPTRRTVHVGKRPFMKPAFDAELPQLMGFFKNSM